MIARATIDGEEVEVEDTCDYDANTSCLPGVACSFLKLVGYIDSNRLEESLLFLGGGTKSGATSSAF